MINVINPVPMFVTGYKLGFIFVLVQLRPFQKYCRLSLKESERIESRIKKSVRHLIGCRVESS